MKEHLHHLTLTTLLFVFYGLLVFTIRPDAPEWTKATDFAQKEYPITELGKQTDNCLPVGFLQERQQMGYRRYTRTEQLRLLYIDAHTPYNKLITRQYARLRMLAIRMRLQLSHHSIRLLQEPPCHHYVYAMRQILI